MSAHSFPGVEYDAGTGGDIYLGKAAALIAAGLLTPEQIPGSPNLPGASGTFVDGVPQPRYTKVPHDEHWMHVAKYATSVRVTKGISPEEQRRRMDARKAEIEEAERNKPKTDIGMDGALKAFAAATARFQVGDRAWNGGHPLVITGECKLRRVRNKDGEFLDAEKGYRVDYQYGYTGQYRNGEEFFFEPNELTDEDGAPTHLRLVAGKCTQAVRPMMEFRERERM